MTASVGLSLPVYLRRPCQLGANPWWPRAIRLDTRCPVALLCSNPQSALFRNAAARLRLSSWRKFPRKIPKDSLLLPVQRPIPQHLGQPQPLRLPPIEDRFHDVRRQAGERQEPADIGVRDALLLRKVGDRLGLTALDRRRQRCARTSALISVSSRRGFGAGTAAPSGVMISFRPPRRCSRIGMRMVRVSTSRPTRSVITLRPPARVRTRPEQEPPGPPAPRRGCESRRHAA